MQKKSLKTKNRIVIGLGALLLGVGLIGSVVLLTRADPGNLRGDYRFVQKINPMGLVPALTGIQTKAIASAESIFTRNGLIQYSYSIHPVDDPTLEIPAVPDRIEIPALKLVAPIVIAEFNFTDLEGETFGQWIAPSELAAAWHPDSALLGGQGNTVLNGHHNAFGKVFGTLIELENGDVINLYSKGKKYTFVVANKMILPEIGQSTETRLMNAAWLKETEDQRLTLVTCWPENSNTHRLIIVASPF
jgi:LPXTG-site transpeptidase (sortase) family protein